MSDLIEFPKTKRVGRDDLLLVKNDLFRLSVHGKELPCWIGAKELENGNLYVVIDNRFASEFTITDGNYDEAYNWIWLLGNAVAIASGYASINHNKAEVDNFAPGIVVLGDPSHE